MNFDKYDDTFDTCFGVIVSSQLRTFYYKWYFIVYNTLHLALACFIIYCTISIQFVFEKRIKLDYTCYACENL